MRRKRRRSGIDAEIKTSSTGDVAFLLIIFFMVTATFAVTKGLKLELPDTEKRDDNDGESSVLVEIVPDGSVRVDCQPMEIGRILDYLRPQLMRNPKKPVIIYAHESVEYRHMVRVYDSVVQAPSRGIPAPDILIPTPGIIEDYIAIFGFDPFENHCRGGRAS